MNVYRIHTHFGSYMSNRSSVILEKMKRCYRNYSTEIHLLLFVFIIMFIKSVSIEFSNVAIDIKCIGNDKSMPITSVIKTLLVYTQKVITVK